MTFSNHCLIVPTSTLIFFDLCYDLGLHLGCKTRSIIWTGVVLCSECIAVYLFSFEIGRLYNMELGGCVRAIVGTSLLILSGCFICDSIRRCFTENTTDQCSSEADFLALGSGVYISRCSHFSIPGITSASFHVCLVK